MILPKNKEVKNSNFIEKINNMAKLKNKKDKSFCPCLFVL